MKRKGSIASTPTARAIKVVREGRLLCVYSPCAAQTRVAMLLQRPFSRLDGHGLQLKLYMCTSVFLEVQYCYTRFHWRIYLLVYKLGP